MSKKDKNRTIQKAVVEFLIIVVGVLTALAADEWRQSLDRQNLERELLEDIQKEFSANLDRIEKMDQYFKALRAKYEPISDISPNDFSALTEDSARSLVQEAHMGRPLLAPRTGVLRSVIDGGQLTSISDRHLRYAIAEWPTHLEYTEAMELQEYKFFLEDWVPAYEAIIENAVDPRQHSPSMQRIAGKQLYFINGYLASLDQLREKTN